MPDLAEALTLELSSDETVATLFVQAGVTPSACDRELVLGVLTEQGIKLGAESLKTIDRLIETLATNPEAVQEVVVARGQRPEHGEDGRFSWVQQFDPAHVVPKIKQTEEVDAAESHYGRSVFRMVEPGDHIATLTPPTLGNDGLTVHGKTIAAKAGKPYQIKLNDSLNIDTQGRITAANAGAVMYDGETLQVSTHLEIAENVDFSTGNIHFEGDITVRQSVRDLFVVHATRDIHIRGLVESAEIVAGRDIKLDVGIAGREKGRATADRDMDARYIDGAYIFVGRNLTVEKEIINSELRVGGKLLCPRGTLAGGITSVASLCEIAELGADCGSPTTLRLGTMNEFQGYSDRLGTIFGSLEKLRAKNQLAYDQLVMNTSSLTPQQAEQMTELQFTLTNLDALSDRMKKATDRVTQIVSENTTVELVVQRVLHSGVILRLGRYEATFKDPLKGPLRITLGANGRPQITDLISDSSRELSDMARVVEMDQTKNKAA